MSAEKNRMTDLVRLYEKKDEIFSKDKKIVNEKFLAKEYNRLKDLTSDSRNADFKENYNNSSSYDLGGQGMSVNSIVQNTYDNPAVSFGAIRQPLKTEEAFDIAIRRTVDSGAPVNNMGFYEEVNWHLAQLGFASRSPLDIKTKLISLLSKDKE